ncbi:MAG: hypothetical protein J1G04_03060 [Clostridiales bacterium]|nr:hypothetical protein [Clostridiales bacterium]
MRIIKRFTHKTAILIVTLAASIALCFGAFILSFSGVGHARAEDTKEYTPTSLDLSNPNFTNSSGSYPATPDGWTGENIDGGSGGVKAGVVDLTASVYDSGSESGNKLFKLNQYPEYEHDDSTPKTIFNPTDRPNTDEKALLINTMPGASVAYAYKSSNMTFNPDSYYRVSAWVKTGNFAPNTGATIKLTGLGNSCSFTNINTVKNIEKDGDGIPVLNKDNNYGWVQYTIFVRTAPSKTNTVNLVLGIGDAPNTLSELTSVPPSTASGYAFFDTVSAESISAREFALSTNDYTSTDGVTYVSNKGTSMALNLFDLDYLEYDGDEIGTFSEGLKHWNQNPSYDFDEDHVYPGQARPTIYPSFIDIDVEENDYGLTQNPWAPFGRAENRNSVNNDMFAGTNGNILMITTHNGKAFRPAAGGVASPDVTIERLKYYRFGVWVKGDSVEGGNGISIAVKGESNDPTQNNKLNQWYNNLDGDSADKVHYGWKEQVVYIQGSAVKDLNVHFELWLGTPDAQSSGIAMFDNVTFTEITYSEYADMSAADSGNVLTLDTAVEDTGVTNGNFANVGDLGDEIEYPLPVAEWDYYNAATVETRGGFSKLEVNTDNAKHGIIPTDDAIFNSIRSGLPGVKNPKYFANSTTGNVLLLSSTTPTAICYSSPDIVINIDKAYKITVDLAVEIPDDSYGASLVLKNVDTAILSTIEGIKNTNNAFKTYTFYLDAPLSDQTLKLEIWLGLNDRKSNASKLSSGNVYVSKVSSTEWTAESNSTIEKEYNAKLEQYKSDIANTVVLKSLDYGVYSFKSPSLAYYDAYSYNMYPDDYAPIYSWNVTSPQVSALKYGVFDTNNMKSLTPYAGFERKDESGAMLLVYNTAPNRSTIAYDNTLQLVSNLYYRLDVTVKVVLSDESKNNDDMHGLDIGITGSVTDKFENIKDTTTLVAQGNENSRDKETFKTYSFYIATGSDGGTLGINLTFGGETPRSYINGMLIISDVSLTSITNTTFEDIENNATEYQKAVRLSEAPATDNTDNTEAPKGEIAWWIIPTVIFGAALLAAIILIIVMRIRDRVKKNKKTTYSSEYDREAAFKELDRLAKADAEAQKADAKADTHNVDEFDEQPSVADDNTVDDEKVEEAVEHGTDDVKEEAVEEKKEVKEEAKEKAAKEEKTDELDD